MIIGFIGAGNMARSLAGGLIAQGTAPHNILLSDPNLAALTQLQQELGVKITQNNHEVAAQAQTIILAVKPQVMKNVVLAIQDTLQQHQPLIISIAAGIQCVSLMEWLGDKIPVIRCMPNTPALVQTAATALYATPHTTQQQKHTAEHILSAVGLAVWVHEEEQLNAVTALSGSGPAYFFYLMEAMIQAGIQMGLSETLSRQLTLQTALGSAKMASQSVLDPATLRTQVTSPGGTTAAAITHFDQMHLSQHIIDALETAKIRSKELAQDFK